MEDSPSLFSAATLVCRAAGVPSSQSNCRGKTWREAEENAMDLCDAGVAGTLVGPTGARL